MTDGIDLSEPISEPERREDVVPDLDDLGSDGFPPLPEPSAVWRDDDDVSPQRQMAREGLEARSEVSRRASEDAALQQAASKFISENPGGHFEIARVGPHDLPPTELGRVGQVKISDVERVPLYQLIADRWGGGEYTVVGRRTDGSLAQVSEREIQVAGDPKMVSLRGKRWLRDQLDGDEPSSVSKNGGEVVTLLREVLRSRDDGGTTAMLQQFMAAQNERLDEIRHERKEAASQERQRFLAEQAEAKEQARLEREKRDREWQLELEERRQEAKDRRERERREWEEEREERRREAKRERARELAAHERALRAQEMAAGGGLGLEGLKQVRTAMADILVTQAKEAAGLSETEASWADVLKTHGPELGGKLLDLIATRGSPAPPSPVSSAAALPAPSQDTGDEPPTTEDTEGNLVGTMIGGKLIGRIRLFTAALASELAVGSDVEAAWSAPQDESGMTLDVMYAMLPPVLREALADNWGAFAAHVNDAAPHEVAFIAERIQAPDAAAWMSAFLDAGPWTEEEGEDDTGDPAVESEEAKEASSEVPADAPPPLTSE